MLFMLLIKQEYIEMVNLNIQNLLKYKLVHYLLLSHTNDIKLKRV